MAKEFDKRYAVLKILIEGDAIETFQQIFNYIPKSVVYKDLGMNYVRFAKLYQNPQQFTLEDLITIAKNIGCDPAKVVHLALKGVGKKPRTRKG